MNQTRQKRLMLLISGFILLAIGISIVLFALRDNLNLYYTPTEVVEGKADGSGIIRIGGLVQKGSLVRGKDVIVEFAVTDSVNAVPILFEGILPDLFRENEGVVVIGELKNNQLVASQVLAKHDENYMPPESLEAMKRALKEKNI